MATETHELVVQMRPEGTDETEDGLENVEGQFDETADSVGDSADEMEGFSTKWRGAMTAIVAGFAVAAAGLASQVPILGELMGGLVAIIESIAFQMDTVLRPVLAPLTDLFFQLSESVFTAEGPLGNAIGLLGSIASLFFLVLVPLDLLTRNIPILLTLFTKIVGVAKLVVAAVSAIAAALGLPVVVVGLVIAAFVALAAALIFNIGGARDFAVGAIETLLSWLGDLADRLISFVTDDLPEFVSGIADKFQEVLGTANDLAADLADWATGLGSDALGWGKDIIDKFIDGIKSKISDVRNAVSDVADTVADKISFDIAANDRMAERWGSDLMQHFSAGIGSELPSVERASSDAQSAAQPTPAFSAGGNSQIAVMLDGRRIDRGTKRFGDEETSLRGRFG